MENGLCEISRPNVTKFHENRLTIDRKISEKHAILVDHF